MNGFAIVPFDREKHRAFVEKTFLDSVRATWPWQMCPDDELRFDLRRRLRRPDTRVGVAISEHDPDLYLGWGAVGMLGASAEVIYAYTLSDFRSKGRFQPRIASSLLESLGADFSKPVCVRYWTEVTRQLSKRPGYQLRHPECP